MKPPDAAGWDSDGSQAAARRTLSVIGTGRLVVQPTRLDVDALIVTESPAPEVAWQQGVDRVYKLTRALEAIGVQPADVEPVSSDLAPTGTSYRLEQWLRVTIRDLKQTGVVLPTILGGGADRLGGMRLGLVDGRAAGDRARERALLDAGDKARMLAQELQLRLGSVSAVEELPGGSDTSASELQTPPPTLEITSVLRVSYALLD